MWNKQGLRELPLLIKKVTGLFELEGTLKGADASPATNRDL